MRNAAATFLVFVLMLDFTLFFVDGGMGAVNPEMNRSRIFEYGDSYAHNYDKGNYTIADYEDGELPDSVTSVDSDNTGFFTDIWSTMSGWVKSAVGGVVGAFSFASHLVNAVPRTVALFHWPAEVSFMVGMMWHALTVIALILFARGD